MASILDWAELGLVARVGAAMILGAIVGLERETQDKPAGLRTHMLVAGAAALFVGLGDTVVSFYTVTLNAELVQADPVRILEAIITGVSFLGAGTIFRREDSVEGLTTAASVFFTTALGVSVALSRYVLAAGGTLLVLITLRLIGLAEDRLERKL